jgi:hypothetical protein
MIKTGLTCPYVISEVANHKEFKEQVLAAIDRFSIDSEDQRRGGNLISKTDWFLDSSIEREYLNIILKYIPDHIVPIFKNLGYESVSFDNIWFQQYYKDNTHKWHRHGNTSWANVYYLELGESSPKTLLLDPMDNKTIIEPPVYEGCVLTFPAFIKHCSPPNPGNGRKTVVAFNISGD